MLTKFLKLLMAALAVFISCYAFRYLFGHRMFGLLQLKSEALLMNLFWNIGFYTHIIPGGIALLIGWIQFIKNIRTKKLILHRTIGKIYVSAALVSSVGAIYIALYATGGIIASLGFMCIGIFWFYSTFKAYTSVRNGNIDGHKNMMIYSYAACLAAVTLRFWLPLLAYIFQDFITAYLIVAWLCWIPNLLVAYYIIRRKQMAGNTMLQPSAALHSFGADAS